MNLVVRSSLRARSNTVVSYMLQYSNTERNIVVQYGRAPVNAKHQRECRGNGERLARFREDETGNSVQLALRADQN